MSKLKKYYFYKPKQLFLIIFLKLVVSLLTVSVSMLLYLIVDLATNNSQFTSFLYLGIISFAIILFLSFSSYFEEYFTHKYINSITEIYRIDVFKGILNQSLDEINSKPTGEYLSILNKDVNSIAENHFTSVFSLISQIFTLILALVYSFFLNYIVTLFILLISILIACAPGLFVRKIYKSFNEYSLAISNLSKYLGNFLDGALIVNNCDAISNIANIVNKVDKTFLNSENKYWRLVSKNNNMTYFLIYILQFFTVFIACILAYFNMANIAICIAFLQISSSIYNPLVQIVASFTYIKSVKQVLERLVVFSNYKTHKKNVKIQKPSICLNNLSISFSNRVVLEDANYCFHFGKKYLLIGKSGIGKSSLLNAIIGYIKVSKGNICIYDDIKGDKINSNERDFNDLIGYVHQKPFLFIGNLVENISMFSKEPDLEKINKIIKQCKLEEFVAQRGLYNILDNSSNNISVGEMQRISLARILYLDKPILFLDEITSSLDQKNSDDINNIIKNIDNKLIILISHNKDVSNLKWIDKKITVDNKRINEL